MDNSKLFDRIKKLLALANSSNENEAKAAAAKANALMVKYNLDAQSIAEADREFEKTLLDSASRISSESKFLTSILNKHFFVEIYTSRKRKEKMTYVSILGSKENIEVAMYVFEFLKTSFRNLWAIEKRDNGGACRQSFYFGLYKGLNEQLSATRKEVEQQTGLIVVEDAALKAFLHSDAPNLKERTSNVSIGDRDSMERGKEAGRNLKIARGLGESNGTTTALLK